MSPESVLKLKHHASAFKSPSAFRYRFVRSDIAEALDDALASLRGRGRIPDVNQFFFRVLGMRRTGNHAMIQWIERSIPGLTLHINDIAIGMNGYRFRHFFPEPDDAPEFSQLMAQGFRRDFTRRAGLICSYEDFSVASFLRACRRERIVSHYGASRTIKSVLLLRDPFNLFASRIKSSMLETKERAIDQKRMYIEHAETFLREEQGDDLVCISYNRWFSDPDYRRHIQGKLGLEPADISIETVARQGGGSSFEGQAMDGKASAMAVLSRWRSMEHHPLFQQLFEDGELERYSALIFGDIRAGGS